MIRGTRPVVSHTRSVASPLTLAISPPSGLNTASCTSALRPSSTGAFSGALADRKGLIRSADGGTLFLDEIGELPPASQAALLRALQEREVLPVGADRALPVDLRVVAATVRDLELAISRGAFRDDL